LTQVGRQAVLAGVTVVFSFVATLVILKVTDLAVGLRAIPDHEDVGLDLSQHGEAGYRWTEAAEAATPVEPAEPPPV
jgi:Amt family ammonium transporter